MKKFLIILCVMASMKAKAQIYAQGVTNNKSGESISVICENECHFVEYNPNDRSTKLLVNGHNFSPDQINLLMNTVLKNKILHPKTRIYRGTKAYYGKAVEWMEEADGPIVIIAAPVSFVAGALPAAAETLFLGIRAPFAGIRNHLRAAKLSKVSLEMNPERYAEFKELVNSL